MPRDGERSPTKLLAPIRDTDYRALAQSLVLGTIGGAIFNALNLPLPWMLGAMLFTSSAAIAGARIAVPMGLRNTMVVILGVMLGSAFDPSILSNIGRWAVSLAGLAVYILVCIALGIVYLRLIARYDPITAFFTATPGGFNEMVLIGGAMGADDRTIAMSHSARVMLVVFTIPLLFQAFGGLDPAARAALNATEIDMNLRDWGLLTGCIIGAPIARLFKLPAAMLLGPMVLSAALHLMGATDAKPPFVLVAAAQVIVGSSVGSRFSGVGIREIARAGLMAVGLTASAADNDRLLCPDAQRDHRDRPPRSDPRLFARRPCGDESCGPGAGRRRRLRIDPSHRADRPCGGLRAAAVRADPPVRPRDAPGRMTPPANRPDGLAMVRSRPLGR